MLLAYINNVSTAAAWLEEKGEIILYNLVQTSHEQLSGYATVSVNRYSDSNIQDPFHPYYRYKKEMYNS